MTAHPYPRGPRPRGAVLALAAAALLAAAGCADPVASVQDEATCPGETCTDDTRDRVAAIEALDGVVEVVEVSRRYGLDRGSARSAEVVSDATGRQGLVDTGLAVVRALEDWPGHADGVATVVVRSAGAEEVTLRLDGEWVCEVVDDVISPCGPDNSWELDGTRVGN